MSRLRAALAQPLPGLPVQMGMAPIPRPGTERILDPFLDCRRAGVLVLLYPGGISPEKPDFSEDAPLYIVLTRRTESVDNHRGQISFPGGSMDPGEDALTTALREAHEELGVDPACVEVLGQLSPLYIPPSGFCIYPVVAYTARRPAFVPSPGEVAEVLEVSVDHLLDPATRQEEIWQIRGQDVRVPFYAVGPYKIWGATAMVLCELLALLSDLPESRL
ncbi:MAG: NUDIX hydrolase [Anaerolineae bacterium]